MPESIPDFDLYAELGVAVDADAATIRAAHRDAVRHAHPDTAPEGVGDDEAKRLNIARDWLLDPGRRARYDESLGLGSWATVDGTTTAMVEAAADPEGGLASAFDRSDAMGCLEVGWWLLLILAAGLIFGTLLLIVADL